MVILDTNAVIYYLQNENKAVNVIELLRERKTEFAISTITELEVLSFPGITDFELFKISVWLNELFIIPVDSIIAREAAKLRRKYHLKSPDAIVAATAILYKGRLVTRDKRFEKLSELKIVSC